MRAKAGCEREHCELEKKILFSTAEAEPSGARLTVDRMFASLPKSHVEASVLNVMELGGGAFGR